MVAYYIKRRLKGPAGIVVVDATSREAAISLLAKSVNPGEEFEILDASTTLAATGITGPTGP